MDLQDKKVTDERVLVGTNTVAYWPQYFVSEKRSILFLLADYFLQTVQLSKGLLDSSLMDWRVRERLKIVIRLC